VRNIIHGSQNALAGMVLPWWVMACPQAGARPITLRQDTDLQAPPMPSWSNQIDFPPDRHHLRLPISSRSRPGSRSHNNYGSDFIEARRALEFSSPATTCRRMCISPAAVSNLSFSFRGQ